ncbi:hypothetical protein ABWW58_02415 [Sporolactobacillus sp. STCC-11]|uniref:hypothetical protein n=1 Tax=Sporolactobacillus caesalpiniae TaxID=3230362 RepID=UPI003392E5C0
MNLESNIKDVISKKLEDGTVEKLISEQLENGVKNALDNLFRSYGDVTEVIEKKVKSVMIPYLESYDYSEYLVKLDSVLVDVLKNSALENKKLLTNFKNLMVDHDIKEIKVTDLFDRWMKFVEENVDTDDLDIDYDDEPTYEAVDVTFEVERDYERDWSCFEHATLTFECEHDATMNFEIKLYRYTKSSNEGWTIDYKHASDLSSLRNIDEFEVFLMNLCQAGTNLIIDSDGDRDEVTPEKRPEPTFE